MNDKIDIASDASGFLLGEAMVYVVDMTTMGMNILGGTAYVFANPVDSTFNKFRSHKISLDFARNLTDFKVAFSVGDAREVEKMLAVESSKLQAFDKMKKSILRSI